MTVLEDLVRKLEDARNRLSGETSKLEGLQRQMGEFMLLNQDVEGIDLSAYREQAEDIQIDINYYKRTIGELKDKIVTAVGNISVD